MTALNTLHWLNLVETLSSATRVMTKPGERRFFIPVPKLRHGGVSFDLAQKAQAGASVGKWTLQNGKGATFINPIDDCWQGVQGDGSGVLIVNLPGDDAAKQTSAQSIWKILHGSGRRQLPRTAGAVSKLIARIASEAGQFDVYNTGHDYMQGNTPQELSQNAIRAGEAQMAFLYNGVAFGFLPKIGLGRAMFVPGAFALIGTSGQDHQMPRGGWIVMLDSKVKLSDGTRVPDIFAVQPELFSYVATDGTELSPNDVTQYHPE